MLSEDLTMMTPAEVIKALKVSRTRVYSWIASGSLPVTRFGRSVRISASDLAAFVERQRQEARAPTSDYRQ